MIANHGQRVKHYHEIIGVNSRLDALQGAILKVKLKYLDQYSFARQKVASIYDQNLEGLSDVILPHRSQYSTHVFNQYTLKIKSGLRDSLKAYLAKQGIPSMIYYPLPIHKQEAYNRYAPKLKLPVTEKLCEEVLSLPMHTELSESDISYICDHIRIFLDASNH